MYGTPIKRNPLEASVFGQTMNSNEKCIVNSNKSNNLQNNSYMMNCPQVVNNLPIQSIGQLNPQQGKNI